MNINALTISISLVLIFFVPYLIIVARKIQNHKIPFLKALNPFYTKEMNEAAKLKESLSPITREMETLAMARVVSHWTAKFEKGLTEQDAVELNAKIENGEQNQVYGILALHPEAKAQFDQINEELKEKMLAVEEELV